MGELSIDIKLVWIFCIGTFLAFLFYLEQTIQKNEIVEKIGLTKVIILVFINSLIGGVVMVTSYYALVQFVPDWHDYLKVGVSGTTAMLGKDMIYLYYRAIKVKTGVKDE